MDGNDARSGGTGRMGVLTQARSPGADSGDAVTVATRAGAGYHMPPRHQRLTAYAAAESSTGGADEFA